MFDSVSANNDLLIGINSNAHVTNLLLLFIILLILGYFAYRTLNRWL